MVEPTYNSIGEFAETYGISRKEMSRYITLGGGQAPEDTARRGGAVRDGHDADRAVQHEKQRK